METFDRNFQSPSGVLVVASQFPFAMPQVRHIAGICHAVLIGKVWWQALPESGPFKITELIIG